MVIEVSVHTALSKKTNIPLNLNLKLSIVDKNYVTLSTTLPWTIKAEI